MVIEPNVCISHFILRRVTFLCNPIYSILLNNQRDAALSSHLYYSLQNYRTCFGCSLHPSSRVH